MINSSELIYRGEDILPEDLSGIYVDSEYGKKVVEKLKSKMPILLEGSRGTGKTILFKVAEKDLDETFNEERVLAILVRFNQSLLIEPKYFKQWMMSKILFAIKSKLRKIVGATGEIQTFNGMFDLGVKECKVLENLDEFIMLLENSWKQKDINIEKAIEELIGTDIKMANILNEVDYFNEIINQMYFILNLCAKFSLKSQPSIYGKYGKRIL